MGCPNSVVIGNNLTFSVCTHDPDTGILTDAATDPQYRIYEADTGTAILTGTMSKLDDGNTTGFYTKSIACSVANGFEDGKSYTIYIEATVSGNTGGISYGFGAYTSIWETLLDGSFSAKDLMRVFGSALAGELSGADAHTVVFKNIEGTENVITATTDAYGNRISVAIDTNY